MPTIAGKPVTSAEIRGTIATLRYYRSFLRSDPQYGECYDLEDSPRHRAFNHWDSRLDRQAAQRRLSMLINVAINRKAGIPDVACRKQESDYQTHLRRDQRRLQDIRRRIRHYQFETAEVRRRFGHLLSRYDD